jgi:hypothetical protein
VRVVLDDDEISSDEDAPLQKWLRLSSDVGGSSGSTPAAPKVVAAMKAVMDREDANRRATEEAAMKVAADKEAADKRVTEEATVKEAVDKEATDKRATKEVTVKEASVGAAGDSSAPGQVPSSATGTKRAAVPSSSTLPAKRFYRGIWKPRFV